jgi:hypothetical protein
MNCVTDRIERLMSLGFGLLCSAVLSAQPLCEVLLRPAFHYTTNGLTLFVADSSLTFGIDAEASWSFGDGSAISSVPYHQFAEAGTYEVCLTLANATLSCTAVFCRQVVVPLDDCGGGMDAYFEWAAGGTNTAGLYDASFNQDPTTRIWEFDDGGTSSEVAPYYTWQLPGAHFVSLTRAADGCTASFGRWVTVDGNTSTCGPGLFVNFDAYPSGLDVDLEPSIAVNGVIPVGSIWSYGDGEVDTTGTAHHTYAEEGSYQACLLVGALQPPSLDSCFALVCRTIDLGHSTGLGQEKEGGIGVWPNPFTERLNLTIPYGSGVAVYRVYDAVGRVITSGSAAGPGPHVLDLERSDAGTYHLVVDANGDRLHTLVVKAQ